MVVNEQIGEAETARRGKQKLPKDIGRVLAGPLARLQLASEVRELAGMAKPVRIRANSRAERRLRRLVSSIRSRLARPDLFTWRSEAVLRLLVARLRLLSGAWKARSLPPDEIVRVRQERQGEFTHPVNGFVTSSFDETMLVRVSLLLRLMRRYGTAVDLLVQRWQSDLPRVRTAYWLRRFLEEVGEKKAVALLKSEIPASSPTATLFRASARRKHAVVMLTMFDSDVFRASLTSLVQSDCGGEILVVEDGLRPEASCREVCERLGVAYLKNPTWSGSAAAMNLGLRALSPATEVVIFVHNDVLWPREWFAAYDRTWDRVLPGGRVGLLNLGYLQFKRRLDPSLIDLFVEGCYDDLVWLLRALRDIPHMMEQIQQCEVRAGEQPFGLARDPWNDWTPDLRQMTGRFSVATSFPYTLWKGLGGFSDDLPYGFDVELQRAALQGRKWILFLGNPPLVHLVSSDTRALEPSDRAAFVEKVHETYKTFERRYGMPIEHFLNLYFSETSILHRHEILDAVNRGRFDEVDWVFDDFAHRLATKTLQTCELTWCRSRATCPYDATIAKPALLVAAPPGDPHVAEA